MFKQTKLAAVVGAAALALSSQAGAVVVVGGDNGWEVSFDGNINAFYTVSDCETGCGAEQDTSRVHSGFLPAFFSFNVKTPTVNGLTGSARISFAPTIHSSKGSNSVGAGGGLVGAQIDTREVVANVDGSFGTISFGRTLGIYGRQAILKDMTLFGVGNSYGGGDYGSVTAGRIGTGYIYPDFQARFSYKTPNMNGFQLEVGMYDPVEPTGTFAGGNGTFETDTPRFEGELTYATAFDGGTFNVWGDFLWQESDNVAINDDITQSGIGVGAQVAFSGFEVTGYYYDGEGLGMGFLGDATSAACGTTICDEADNDGYYFQGTYTFNGKTKVGLSYGESNTDGFAGATGGPAASGDLEQTMWSVGVYHDVNSWLKLVAEYNDREDENETTGATTLEWDAFSVGAFLTW
jgi:hypothetical protein